MAGDVLAAKVKQILRSFSTYTLMIALSPVFLILALLYLILHQTRAHGITEENPAGALISTN
jgi:hypothetical protein